MVLLADVASNKCLKGFVRGLKLVLLNWFDCWRLLEAREARDLVVFLII